MVSLGTRQALSNVGAALGLPAGSALNDRWAGGHVVRPPGAGLSKSARQQANKAAKFAGAPGQASQGAQHKAQGQQHGQKAHPKNDKAGLYITTKEGREICYRFAKGGESACPSPCTAKRVHACQHCLQPHCNAECGGRRPGQGGRG